MTDSRNNTSPSPSDLGQLLKDWLSENRAMLEIFLDAYCVVDANNQVVDFNVAFTELCGESYRKVLKIGNFCELLKTEFCPTNCPAEQIRSSKKSMRLDELKASSRAHSSLQIILGGIPITGPGGVVLGTLMTIRNVSAESELQKKYDERKRESITDGLTRLYNKTYTESTLLRTMKIALREIQAMSVVMVDIDFFKKVNDTYGHQAGDYVLATVAQLLKGEVRETDIVGRYGGEEFIVILANSDVEGAKIFSERFRSRVEQTPLVFEGKRIPVTVSLGTATFQEKWRPGFNPENMMKEVIHKADNALYFAKAAGRNRTAQWEKLPRKEDKAA